MSTSIATTVGRLGQWDKRGYQTRLPPPPFLSPVSTMVFVRADVPVGGQLRVLRLRWWRTRITVVVPLLSPLSLLEPRSPSHFHTHSNQSTSQPTNHTWVLLIHGGLVYRLSAVSQLTVTRDGAVFGNFSCRGASLPLLNRAFVFLFITPRLCRLHRGQIKFTVRGDWGR